ncbi:MAG: outer membrane protein transport protein, partial [Bilophila sp.]
MKRIVTLLFSGFALCALIGLTSSNVAQAEGFALSDYGARGTSLAGGMIGRADDASAVAWNPAGITQLPGTRTMFGGTFIAPTGTVDTIENGVTTSTDVEKHIWANPHAYLTHQYNDSLWFGLGVFSRFGLGNSYPDDWAGSRNLTSVSLQTISLNPNVAYKVNDNLSLAAGVEIMGASMRMTKDYDLRQLGYDQQMLKGKSVAVAFNLAAHYTFNEQWAAGFTYRSRLQQKVEGKSSFSREFSAIPGRLPQLKDSDLHGTLNLPDVFSFGVTWKPLADLSFEAGTVYTVWSNFRSMNIYLEEPMRVDGFTPKNWRDTWAFNLSSEYRVLD